MGLHSHVAESKVQAMVGLQWYGKTATAQLDALGALGPHFTVAHGVWLDDDDMRRLGDHGASIAHNPGSNMRLGNGFGDMHAMLARRVNVGIGTDGANCSDNQNVYEALRLAALVSKGRTPDVERWVTTEQAALAVTEGGARALGFEGRLGRLAPGYKADIVFLDLGHPNWIPLNDPTNQLVHTEDGGAVRDVMIGGRLVVKDHRVTTVDLAGEASLLRLPLPARHLSAPAVEDGRACRWVNDREARLFLPLAREGAIVVTLRARALETPEPQFMDVSWNEADVGRVEMSPAWADYRFHVPAAAVVAGTNVLVLRFDRGPVYHRVRGEGPHEVRPAALSTLTLHRSY